MTLVSTGGVNIIPVHLNIVFTSEYISFNANLDEDKFTSIIQELSEDEIYILDFNNIKNTLATDAIATVASGLLGKKILMINLKNSTYNIFLRYFSDKMEAFEKPELGRCLRTKKFPPNITLPDLKNFQYLYDRLVKECKDNMLKEDGEPKLISSNVYINMYFELKNLFENIHTVRTIVYLMACKLEKWVNENELSEYKLLSSSFNGCIVGNLLALVMGREHISIPHLGPENSKEDNRYIDYIEEDDKFVYIYDFIALGNEQKTTSLITHLQNAEIVRSLGLAYFKPSQKEKEKTYSLIDLGSISGNVYIAAEKKEFGGKIA